MKPLRLFLLGLVLVCTPLGLASATEPVLPSVGYVFLGRCRFAHWSETHFEGLPDTCEIGDTDEVRFKNNLTVHAAEGVLIRDQHYRRGREIGTFKKGAPVVLVGYYVIFGYAWGVVEMHPGAKMSTWTTDMRVLCGGEVDDPAFHRLCMFM